VKNSDQIPAMTKAGSVKIAPAATDSPMDPTVRAKFSSRMFPPSRAERHADDRGGRSAMGAGPQSEVGVGRAEHDAHTSPI
jgi:hypothetical protein